jgi:hypothetical protein
MNAKINVMDVGYSKPIMNVTRFWIRAKKTNNMNNPSRSRKKAIISFPKVVLAIRTPPPLSSQLMLHFLLALSYVDIVVWVANKLCD